MPADDAAAILPQEPQVLLHGRVGGRTGVEVRDDDGAGRRHVARATSQAAGEPGQGI